MRICRRDRRDGSARGRAPRQSLPEGVAFAGDFRGTRWNEKRGRSPCFQRFTDVSRSLQIRIWSGKRVSNSRPQPWQGCALPTELFPRATALTPCEVRNYSHAPAFVQELFQKGEGPAVASSGVANPVDAVANRNAATACEWRCARRRQTRPSCVWRRVALRRAAFVLPAVSIRVAARATAGSRKCHFLAPAFCRSTTAA